MKSIRSKLWAGMMSLVLIVLVLLWLFQVVFLDRFYLQMKIGEIENRAATIMGLLDDNQAEFADQMELLAYDNNLSIQLLDQSGEILYQTSSAMNGQMMMMMRNVRSQVYEATLAGTKSTATFTHPRLGSNYLMIGIPDGGQGQVERVLMLSVPLAPVDETVSILQRQLIYISIILLGAALLISFLLARTFTRPVLDINQAAKQMATGDFSARAAITQEDEIGQLARTINHLGEQLAQIEKLRKDLIANVSHELRTPLSLIQGYAETLRDVTGESPEKRDRQLGIIIEETQRLSQIVNDILNLSQLQSGQMHLQQDCFNIRNLTGRAAQRYELLSQQTGVALQLEAEYDLKAYGDEARIEQVLYNLVSNAYNYVNPDGRIIIAAFPLDDQVRLEVTNTGPGIDEQDLPHIWDRFYKSSHRMAGATGSGLGLAIVKAVLEAHGAAFGVESQPGLKTTFWLQLKKC